MAVNLTTQNSTGGIKDVSENKTFYEINFSELPFAVSNQTKHYQFGNDVFFQDKNYDTTMAFKLNADYSFTQIVLHTIVAHSETIIVTLQGTIYRKYKYQHGSFVLLNSRIYNNSSNLKVIILGNEEVYLQNDIQLINYETGDVSFLAPNEYEYDIYQTFPLNSRIFYSVYSENTGDLEFYVLNPTTGQTTDVTHHFSDIYQWNLQLIKTERDKIFLFDNEYGYVVVLNAADNTVQKYPESQYDFMVQNNNIYFYGNDRLIHKWTENSTEILFDSNEFTPIPLFLLNDELYFWDDDSLIYKVNEASKQVTVIGEVTTILNEETKYAFRFNDVSFFRSGLLYSVYDYPVDLYARTTQGWKNIQKKLDTTYEIKREVTEVKSEITGIKNTLNTGVEKKPQNTLRIFRSNAIFQNDLVQLTANSNKMCDIKKLIVRTSLGDSTPDFRIIYDAGYAWISSSKVSKSVNWEYIEVSYDLVNNPATYLPDLRGKIGRNFMQDEISGNISHSRINTDFFKATYLGFLPTGSRQALQSIEVKGSSIESVETDEMAVIHKFNLLARPYVNAAVGEEVSSCPDVLSVGSHYGNYYAVGKPHGIQDIDPAKNTGVRYNITTQPYIFLNNTIAVTAGENPDGTGVWASWGFGVEFCETYADMVVRYPDEQFKIAYRERIGVFVAEDKRTITPGNGFESFIAKYTYLEGWQVGMTLFLHMSASEIIEFQVVEINAADNYIIADRDLPVFPKPPTGNAGMKYLYTYFNPFREIAIPYPPSEPHYPQQSPVCSIIAAKLAVIQDLTDAPWQLVREAARMTASCSTFTTVNGKKVWTTNWHLKLGFGVINVVEAVQYIKDNYSENNTYKDSAIINLQKLNPMLTLDDLEDDNPISKKMLEKRIAQLELLIQSLS